MHLFMAKPGISKPGAANIDPQHYAIDYSIFTHRPTDPVFFSGLHGSHLGGDAADWIPIIENLLLHSSCFTAPVSATLEVVSWSGPDRAIDPESAASIAVLDSQNCAVWTSRIIFPRLFWS
jgi:hypothetical protein